jgi:hypothetical protein
MTANLVVGVGQCGTQVLSHLLECSNSKALPHAIFIDTENKSVSTAAASSGAGQQSQVVAQDNCGRGNNWAHGFHGSLFDSNNFVGIEASEMIRQRIEQTDESPSISICHAWGGGTGSGLGSFLVQQLRDELLGSKGGLTSLGVCPFIAGGSPLQSINTVLCAAQVHEMCTGAIVQFNDEVLQLAQSGTGASTSIKGQAAPFFMQRMNETIGERFACIIPPQIVASHRYAALSSLLGSWQRGGAAGLAHTTQTGGTQPAENLHTCVEAALRSNSERLRFLGLLQPPILGPRTSVHGSRQQQAVLLQGVDLENPKHCTDPVRQAWHVRRLKSLTARETSAYAAPEGRSSWLAADTPSYFNDGHMSIKYAQKKATNVDVSIMVNEEYMPRHTAAVIDGSFAAVSPLLSFAALAERKVSVGAYMHLYEPFGVDSNQVKDANEVVRVWCDGLS